MGSNDGKPPVLTEGDPMIIIVTICAVLTIGALARGYAKVERAKHGVK